MGRQTVRAGSMRAHSRNYTRDFIRPLFDRRLFRLFDEGITFERERKLSHPLAWLICVAALYGVCRRGIEWPFIAGGMALLLMRIIMAYSDDDHRRIGRALEDNLAARFSLGAILLLSAQVAAHFAGLDLATGPLSVIVFAFSVGIVTTTSFEWSGWRNGDVVFPSRTVFAIRRFTLLVFALSIIQSVMYTFGRSVIRTLEGVVLLIGVVVTIYAIILFPPSIRQVYRLKPRDNTHFIIGRPPDPPSVSFALALLVLLSILITWGVLLVPILTAHPALLYASARTEVSIISAIISVSILFGSSLSLALVVRQKNYWLRRR